MTPGDLVSAAQDILSIYIPEATVSSALLGIIGATHFVAGSLYLCGASFHLTAAHQAYIIIYFTRKSQRLDPGTPIHTMSGPDANKMENVRRGNKHIFIVSIFTPGDSSDILRHSVS